MAKANRTIKQAAPVHKNELVTAEITDLTYQGLGVAKIDGFPLFVTNALPGEKAEILVTKVLKNYGFARVQTLLEESPDRVDLADQLALTTGIAPLANLAYPAQLAWKQRQVQELFKKAKLDVTVVETVGMDDPTHYRNKAQVPARMVDGRLETGFFRRGSHKLIPTDSFYIQDPAVDEAVRVTRDILQDLQIAAYDEESDRGVVRHVMARIAKATGELMVVLVTKTKKLPQADEIVARLRERLPHLQSVVQNVNSAQTNVIMGRTNQILWGKDAIEDVLLGKKYLIGPNSFYQVNPVTTAKLYQLAKEKAQLQPTDIAIDAYCGIGTIALTVADAVAEVYGVEVVDAAIEDAKKNARLNQVGNTHFIAADAPSQMREWAEADLKPDVVFVDPPRKGLTADFIEAVGVMSPKRLVYVSCNPATMARDAQGLLDQGYQIDGPIQPVDQFPQTTHVEAVAVFTKKA
ncbi:23S rRNA (uracil-5-)-methyltransferase RumA [Fructobacillus pseudoficulneus]|uniref:23S rRNA (Uracil-5-)-methyltransferase RumA n=1 Tax=Fructobacillus pseudoficulneus TaxID=220714 RepID=A0A3F3GVI4_9LACO|nr:23S rRNA (uracil(1939)-C(5))-methyltransferase RlmD [Fructobacillus pseudoficulneus]GAP02317.1 23S rRNA (uracil-5-)-methyltransferase RumA [Fructobacillus pseudoficulneus]SEH36369.1 23S rRNA (uracil1939-C5)-methyltransferase [Fructobacillus pseudoficulneus]